MVYGRRTCNEQDEEEDRKYKDPDELECEIEATSRKEVLKDNDEHTECSSDTASTFRDLEKVESGIEGNSPSASNIKDDDLVSWESPDDPLNPRNWTKGQKWLATIMAAAFTLISPVASSMCAPALQTIANDFDISNEVESQLVLSIFVLAYALGPLFLGPLSEIFGRVIVLQTSNLFFAIFNLVCGFAQNKGQMIAFRFLAGLGGSAPLAIGGAIIGDCWKAHERGRAVAVFSLMPLLATAIGKSL